MSSTKKNINFLTKDELSKSVLGRFLKWAMSVGRLVVILTNLIVIAVIIARFKLDNDLQNLNEELTEKQTVITASQELEQNVRSLQKRLNLISQYQNKGLQPITTLDTLTKIIPLDVAFSELTLQENNLNLTADSYSNSGLATFLSLLKQSGQFEQINLKSVVSDASEKANLQFQLSSQIIKTKPWILFNP